jgi:hypothetical protein
VPSQHVGGLLFCQTTVEQQVGDFWKPVGECGERVASNLGFVAASDFYFVN